MHTEELIERYYNFVLEKAREKIMLRLMNANYCPSNTVSGYSLADKPAPQCVAKPCAEIKKEETMSNNYIQVSNDAGKSDEMTKSEYLRGRMVTLYYVKCADLRKAFNLDDDEPPHTSKELVERIQAGRFELPKPRFEDSDEEDCDYYDSYSSMSNIRWRSSPADKEGHKAAFSKMEKAYGDARDDIMIKTPAEGLEILRAFESATFN